ncbi:MAG: type II toxin-antitoxin system RelE/ParE family toxin [Bacteroidales bacterium]|nr:type II toxin-antitoxin system RelE/ParE family toxin [Bacteroidales bacterium]
MSKINFKIRDIALKDMQEIADYIAQDNVNAANNLISDFYSAFKSACKHPKIGSTIVGYHDREVRKIVINKRYIIFYKKIDNTIYILRVLGSYQDICNKL